MNEKKFSPYAWQQWQEIKKDLDKGLSLRWQSILEDALKESKIFIKEGYLVKSILTAGYTNALVMEIEILQGSARIGIVARFLKQKDARREFKQKELLPRIFPLSEVLFILPVLISKKKNHSAYVCILYKHVNANRKSPDICLSLGDIILSAAQKCPEFTEELLYWWQGLLNRTIITITKKNHSKIWKKSIYQQKLKKLEKKSEDFQSCLLSLQVHHNILFPEWLLNSKTRQEKIDSLLEKGIKISQGFCHGDLHPENILYIYNQNRMALPFIIDLEGARLNHCPFYDMAYLYLSICYRFFKVSFLHIYGWNFVKQRILYLLDRENCSTQDIIKKIDGWSNLRHWEKYMLESLAAIRRTVQSGGLESDDFNKLLALCSLILLRLARKNHPSERQSVYLALVYSQAANYFFDPKTIIEEIPWKNLDYEKIVKSKKSTDFNHKLENIKKQYLEAKALADYLTEAEQDYHLLIKAFDAKRRANSHNHEELKNMREDADFLASIIKNDQQPKQRRAEAAHYLMVYYANLDEGKKSKEYAEQAEKLFVGSANFQELAFFLNSAAIYADLPQSQKFRLAEEALDLREQIKDPDRDFVYGLMARQYGANLEWQKALAMDRLNLEMANEKFKPGIYQRMAENFLTCLYLKKLEGDEWTQEESQCFLEDLPLWMEKSKENPFYFKNRVLYFLLGKEAAEETKPTLACLKIEEQERDNHYLLFYKYLFTALLKTEEQEHHTSLEFVQKALDAKKTADGGLLQKDIKYLGLKALETYFKQDNQETEDFKPLCRELISPKKLLFEKFLKLNFLGEERETALEKDNNIKLRNITLQIAVLAQGGA